jgi:hypothetical protein
MFPQFGGHAGFNAVKKDIGKGLLVALVCFSAFKSRIGVPLLCIIKIGRTMDGERSLAGWGKGGIAQ